MKKQLLVAGLAATLATTGFAIDASAEELANRPLESTTEASTTEGPVTQVTKADVDAARAELVAAEVAEADQSQVTAQARSEKDGAEQAVTSAEEVVKEKEKLVQQATPEAIAQASTAVQDAKTALEEARRETTVAKEKEAAAQSTMTAQTAVVAGAQELVKQKTQVVAVAQSEVDRAQAILENADPVQLQEAVAEADKAVTAAQDAEAEAVTALEQAKQSDARRQMAIETAQSTLKATEAAAVTAAQELETANENAEVAAIALDIAKAALTDMANQLSEKPLIELSEDYIRYMKEAYDYSTGFGSEAEAKRAAANQNLLALGGNLYASNQFVASDSDSNISLDLVNLTQEQKTTLTLFAVDLSNQVRLQMETDLVGATTSSVDMGWFQADYYANKLTSMWEMAHDTALLERQFGLSWVDENLAGHLGRVRTMADAKRAIYEAYKQWLFATDESLHASSIAGVRNTVPGVPNYIGIGLSVYPDGSLMVNYNNVNDGGHTTITGNFDTTLLEDPNSAPVLAVAYAILEETLRQAEQENEAALTKQEAARRADVKAKLDVIRDKGVLEAATAQPVLTPTATTALQEAKDRLQAARQAADQAKANLANASADTQTKQDNLQKAKQQLAQAQGELEKSRADLSHEQSDLERLQQELRQAKENTRRKEMDLEAAQTNLIAKETYLASLLSAQLDLDAARKDLVTKQELLTLKQTALTAEEEALEKRQAETKIARDKFERLSLAYRLVMAKQEEEGTKVKQTSSVVTSTGRLASKTSSKQELPRTGEQSSEAALLVGILLTSVGLLPLRKKEA